MIYKYQERLQHIKQFYSYTCNKIFEYHFAIKQIFASMCKETETSLAEVLEIGVIRGSSV